MSVRTISASSASAASSHMSVSGLWSMNRLMWNSSSWGRAPMLAWKPASCMYHTGFLLSSKFMKREMGGRPNRT